MEGESLSTSNMSMTTASYLNREIQWGHRFKTCVYFDRYRGSYVVDHKLFNSTEEVYIPLCSAKRLNEILEEISESNDIDSEVHNLPRLDINRDEELNNNVEIDDKDSGRYTLSPVVVHRQNVVELDDAFDPFKREKNIRPPVIEFSRELSSLLGEKYRDEDNDDLKFIERNHVYPKLIVKKDASDKKSSFTHDLCETEGTIDNDRLFESLNECVKIHQKAQIECEPNLLETSL